MQYIFGSCVPGYSLSGGIRSKSRYFLTFVIGGRAIIYITLFAQIRFGRERIKRPVCKDSLWTITLVSPAGGTGTQIRWKRENDDTLALP